MNNTFIIPKIFFQTSKEKLDPYVIDLIKNKLNSDWEYFHFIDSEIIDFFTDNPDPEFPNIIDLFNKIVLGQHKADLFRYYFLYKKGGIFIDSDVMLYQHIDTVINNNSFFSVLSNAFCDGGRTIFQGIIGCYPKHPFIYKALKNFYNMDLSILDISYRWQNYLRITKDFYNIINTNESQSSYTLYNEVYVKQHNYFNITNNDNKILFKHFYSYVPKLNKEFLDLHQLDI